MTYSPNTLNSIRYNISTPQYFVINDIPLRDLNAHFTNDNDRIWRTVPSQSMKPIQRVWNGLRDRRHASVFHISYSPLFFVSPFFGFFFYFLVLQLICSCQIKYLSTMFACQQLNRNKKLLFELKYNEYVRVCNCLNVCFMLTALLVSHYNSQLRLRVVDAFQWLNLPMHGYVRKGVYRKSASQLIL